MVNPESGKEKVGGPKTLVEKHIALAKEFICTGDGTEYALQLLELAGEEAEKGENDSAMRLSQEAASFGVQNEVLKKLAYFEEQWEFVKIRKDW